MKTANRPLMMTSDLLALYPTGEHLEGNFVQDYIDHYEMFDRNVTRRYGDRQILVPKDDTSAEVMDDWIYDMNAIVFTHLNDWAKMYSALIKDYEPLWNVDGTEITTYGATRDTDVFGNTSSTVQYGATQNTMQYGQQSNTYGSRDDTHTDYKTSYPDSTEVKTDKGVDNIGQQINTSAQHTDTASSISHSDTATAQTHTDTHSGDQHVDTLRRTGNIGVTKSTELVESEATLRTKWNFFDMIFKFMMKEVGANYYENEWHRCEFIPR